ncbi:MAG: HesA/MoeB/ThiF family protein, partial [Deltaproteobacteria bacterium]|nr:HesA/MoeB/ThiF family protein [Deltaproteobacteria bacterium]
VYLAVAGIGRLRICDNGSVELSNLNRQILYGDHDIDRLKVSAAKNQVNRLNPQVTVDCFSETMVRENVGDLIGDADIIVDCLDNFETRLILNEYAVAHGLPFVHAGIEGFAGQLTFIHSPATPCLRCITPEVPAKKLFSVVGTTPGVVGCLEANEVIKYLTGIGSNSRNTLLIWDGLKNELHRVEIAKDPECPVCGKKTDK